MIECAQVFAQQAKAAGVTVNVKILDSGDLLRRPVPEVDVRDRLLGHARLPLQVGAGSLPARRTTRRTGRRRTRTSRRSTTRPGSTTDETKRAPRSCARCSRSSTTRAATSSGASEPDRRLQRPSSGASQTEPGHPQPRLVRAWLSEHLVRLSEPGWTPSPAIAAPSTGGPAAGDGRASTAHAAVAAARDHRLHPAPDAARASLTLFVVSIIVFAATQALPGDPARAILGRTATPDSLPRCASSSAWTTGRAAVLRLAHRPAHGDLGQLAGGRAAGH